MFDSGLSQGARAFNTATTGFRGLSNLRCLIVRDVMQPLESVTWTRPSVFFSKLDFVLSFLGTSVLDHLTWLLIRQLDILPVLLLLRVSRRDFDGFQGF